MDKYKSLTADNVAFIKELFKDSTPDVFKAGEFHIDTQGHLHKNLEDKPTLCGVWFSAPPASLRPASLLDDYVQVCEGCLDSMDLFKADFFNWLALASSLKASANYLKYPSSSVLKENNYDSIFQLLVELFTEKEKLHPKNQVFPESFFNKRAFDVCQAYAKQFSFAEIQEGVVKEFLNYEWIYAFSQSARADHSIHGARVYMSAKKTWNTVRKSLNYEPLLVFEKEKPSFLKSDFSFDMLPTVSFFKQTDFSCLKDWMESEVMHFYETTLLQWVSLWDEQYAVFEKKHRDQFAASADNWFVWNAASLKNHRNFDEGANKLFLFACTGGFFIKDYVVFKAPECLESYFCEYATSVWNLGAASDIDTFQILETAIALKSTLSFNKALAAARCL